jgi:heme-degrading monooxygenase HmoA
MICRTYDVPDGTLDQYDKVSNAVGSEKPDGAHAHIAMKTDDGIRVIEVWDSTDAVERWMQSGLGEAMGKADIPQPTITDFEVHNFDWAG